MVGLFRRQTRTTPFFRQTVIPTMGILRTGLAPKSLFRIAISLVVTNCMTPNTRSTKFFLGKGPALIPFFHNWCSLMAGDGTRKLLIIMGSILRPKTARPNQARLLEVNIDTLRGLPRGPHQNRLDPNALHQYPQAAISVQYLLQESIKMAVLLITPLLQTARAKFRRSRNVVVADKSQFCALSISRLLRTRRVSSPRAARRHFCGGGWRWVVISSLLRGQFSSRVCSCTRGDAAHQSGRHQEVTAGGFVR
ncbi:uncharacterized protein PgNI_12388 [Pyricularia grisea]|uniref:Uncharacterized protein n=1 Tax=Pyricularia grisea TaxID=148305 RepID=A0A6P8AN19_PYRGI|nr:uncharacterized protein PgNI_12388 [Pyricularia grisea]TLD03420.1 hypothetical protein PgNI_12388 [Pyricularia grisea]